MLIYFNLILTVLLNVSFFYIHLFLRTSSVCGVSIQHWKHLKSQCFSLCLSSFFYFLFFYFCRYLPPEIGCLEKLEDLDLSFNKLKNLPNDIAALSALKSLRVANNKLIELPSGLSSLQRLVNLDFSNNRLTSLKSLKLDSMTMLQNLNLQVSFNTHCDL